MRLGVRTCLKAQCFQIVFRLRKFSPIEHAKSLFFKFHKQRFKDAILPSHADIGPSSRKESLLSDESLELNFHNGRAESRKEYFKIK